MWPIMLHELPIYEEQAKCAYQIITAWNRQNSPILLIAEMQQGKTGTLTFLISEFKKKCLKNKQSYQIVYIINLRDNEVRLQTETRLTRAGLRDDVTVLHHANINKIEPLNVDARLIIIDECHVALGKERPFHNFMERFGVKYGESIDAWADHRNFVISVSATPYCHIIKTKFDINSFKPIVLEMSPDYYSLQHMKTANRIKQSEPMVDSNDNITDYFKRRVEEFFAICSATGPGYLIVRTQGTKLQRIFDFLSQYGTSVSVQTFNCKSGNINMLDVTLDTTAVKPTFIIISGSLRAGKTLTTTRHIKMWLDSHNAKADTICQSIGRCLGFPSNNHNKFDDGFSIYCNTKELDACIEFFNKYDCSPKIPGSNWSKPYSEKNNSTEITSGEYKTIEISEYDLRNLFQDVAIIRTCSKNNQHNVALTVLNNSNRGHAKNSQSLEKTKKLEIYFLDAANPNYYEDFKKLKQDKPHLIGKFVKFVVKNDFAQSNEYMEDYLRKDGMFLASI